MFDGDFSGFGKFGAVDPQGQEARRVKQMIENQFLNDLLIPLARKLPKVRFGVNGKEMFARGEPNPDHTIPGHQGRVLLMALMEDQTPEVAAELRKWVDTLGVKTMSADAIPVFVDPDTIMDVDRA